MPDLDDWHVLEASSIVSSSYGHGAPCVPDSDNFQTTDSTSQIRNLLEDSGVTERQASESTGIYFSQATDSSYGVRDSNRDLHGSGSHMYYPEHYPVLTTGTAPSIICKSTNSLSSIDPLNDAASLSQTATPQIPVNEKRFQESITPETYGDSMLTMQKNMATVPANQNFIFLPVSDSNHISLFSRLKNLVVRVYEVSFASLISRLENFLMDYRVSFALATIICGCIAWAIRRRGSVAASVTNTIDPKTSTVSLSSMAGKLILFSVAVVSGYFGSHKGQTNPTTGFTSTEACEEIYHVLCV